MKYPHLPNISLLMNTLGEIEDPDKKTLETLGKIYEIKHLTVNYIKNNQQDKIDKFLSADYLLGERVIKPSLISDPKSISFDKDKLEKHYNVFGHDVKFKIDTGAVTNVGDAKVNWECSDEDLFLYAAAYKEYVEIYPDDGAMRQKHLKELSPQYHHLNFGRITGFDLTVHRKGKDSDIGQPESEHQKSKVVKINRSYKVVGISSPAKDSKKGETPFPVINTVFKDSDSGKNIRTTVALKPRNMTIRGLLSRIFINKHDIGLIPEQRNTTSIDLSKIDLDAVNQVLQPALIF